MVPPTLAQQRGLTFAPIPVAIVSFASSSYVIYYLLCKERQRLNRLYHRLVLAMNFALLPLTFTYAWSTFAVPEGTPNYVGASGTQNTCTAQGFIFFMLIMTVALYYASLALQAFMGIKHKFNEEEYRWIEKYIHLLAFILPLALATVVAATENYNPSGGGCAIGRAPMGCEADPNVPCERGEDIETFIYVAVFTQLFVPIIFPPSVSIGMYCWIKKIKIKMSKSVGMQQVREAARKEMLQSIAMQISLYLFSYWFTYVPTVLSVGYEILTGKTSWDLTIVANCIFALQGFIMAVVYFALERLGTPKSVVAQNIASSSCRPGVRRQLTVMDIRSNVKRKTDMALEVVDEIGGSSGSDSFVFNIFDGVPDEDSPWARFIDCGDDTSIDGEMPDMEETLPNVTIEET